MMDAPYPDMSVLFCALVERAVHIGCNAELRWCWRCCCAVLRRYVMDAYDSMHANRMFSSLRVNSSKRKVGMTSLGLGGPSRLYFAPWVY